jgi:hypothetical protein
MSSVETYQDVLSAVREHMAKGPRTTSWVIIDLAREHDIDIQGNNYTGYSTAEGRTLASRVSRALNHLANEGVLIKSTIYTHGRRKESRYILRTMAEEQAREKAEQDERRAPVLNPLVGARKAADHAVLRVAEAIKGVEKDENPIGLDALLMIAETGLRTALESVALAREALDRQFNGDPR